MMSILAVEVLCGSPDVLWSIMSNHQKKSGTLEASERWKKDAEEEASKLPNRTQMVQQMERFIH